MSTNQRLPGIVRVDCARHSGPANTKGVTHDLRHRREWNPEPRGHQTARRAEDTVSRRLFSESAAQIARARGIEAATIDYNHPATLRAAFHGCDAVFLLGPNALNQTELELNAVDAARAAGVRHIVKQSVMGAAEEAYSLAKVHRPVEKAIERSGMVWTFLRPNSFMQNAVTFMAPTIKAESAFYSASGQARISHIDVRDIAAVAVAALVAAGHEKVFTR